MRAASRMQASGKQLSKERTREMTLLSHFPGDVKAGTGNRTRDLRTTNATLYRLSHASKSIFVSRDYVSLSNTISFVNQNKEKKSPKRVQKETVYLQYPQSTCSDARAHMFTTSHVHDLRARLLFRARLLHVHDLRARLLRARLLTNLFTTSELACCESAASVKSRCSS